MGCWVGKTKMSIPKNWSEEYQYETFKALYAKFEQKWDEELNGEDVEIKHIGEFEKEADEIIAHRGQVKNIATGYKELDGYLEGLDKGELIIVSGSTATGKTLFCLNMLIGAYILAKQTFSTLVFTLEMTKPQITARIKSLLEDTDYKDELSAMPIYYYSSKKDPSIKTMRSAIEKCKKENGVDLILIDHLHYFSRNVENATTEIGILVREIKKIAVDYDIPILLVSHIRKKLKGESKANDPDIDDLKDSAAIGQDADMVIMLNRDKMDNEKSNQLTVLIEKNRNKGKVGGMQMFIKTPQFKLFEQEEYYAKFGEV